MESFQHKGGPVRLFWRRALSLSLLILVLAGFPGVWRIYKRERESATLKREAAAHLADLTVRADRLKADIAKLETDRGKEAALREQYRLGRPGEGLIIIVNPPPPAAQPATSTPLIRWFKYMFPWW